MKCGNNINRDKVPSILSFSRASPMVHIGSGEFLRIFLGSMVWYHACVPGKTPVIPHGASGPAGLGVVPLSLIIWLSHLLLPLMNNTCNSLPLTN